MGNLRWPLGSSLAPRFSVFHSFMHHSAFKLDLHERTYELTVLKGDILHYCQGLVESLQKYAKLVTTSFQ